jgi:multiple sugar transport system ATP-binding protein
MAGLNLNKINKIYPNGFHAAKDVELKIEDKEFMVLVGPSGCGKTTTLRMIAGLEEISSGELFIGENKVNDTPPKDRDIAMVFQNYALYPHMTVYDNMAFGLKLRKQSKAEIEKRVKHAAQILGIEPLLDRKPKQLSGGQRQRVALGRAIVRNPKVFLMDEPLSNLDAKLRVQMRSELIKLHHELSTTFIYVTHDQTEAMTMGTRICVMNAGEIQQVDNPHTIYEKPVNMFVAGFIGAPQMNFTDALVKEDGARVLLEVNGTPVELAKEKGQVLKDGGYVGKEIVIGIRPEHILLDSEGPKMEGKVTVTELLGAELILYIGTEGKELIGRVDPDAGLKIGDAVHYTFAPEKIHLFDKETEKSIIYG